MTWIYTHTNVQLHREMDKTKKKCQKSHDEERVKHGRFSTANEAFQEMIEQEKKEQWKSHQCCIVE